MIRLHTLLLLVMFALSIQHCGQTSHHAAPTIRASGTTEIRVRNASNIDFEDVFVGGKNYGDIRQGATSGYQTWEKAYGYSQVILFADSRKLYITPIDFHGASPLGTGNFTYVLTMMKNGELDIRAEKDTE